MMSYGPKPIARVLQACGREPEVARDNPWYHRALISDYAQRWLARTLMPRFDRWLLRHFGGRRDRFASLPPAARAHLSAHFAADNRALREFVDWEPADFGYVTDS